MSGGLFTIIGILIGVFVTLFVHNRDRKDKYLFSLINEKFKTAQQGYVYSKLIKSVIHGDEQLRMKTLIKIQKWLDNNCLYLSPEIRDDFKDTLWNTWFYKDELALYYETKKSGKEKDTKKAWDELKKKFDKITHLENRIANSLNIYYEYEK